MNLKPYTNENTVVLIRSHKIECYFDQENLHCRQNSDKPLENAFHENWIYKDLFHIPSFWIENGKAFVGVGRHRLLILSKNMGCLPAGFEGAKDKQCNSQVAYRALVVKQLNEFEDIIFPDLKIKNLGKDIDGHPRWKDPM